MKASRFFFITVLLAACLTSAATEIYAPSLASIAHIMNVPITQSQLSLTIFMFGLALSQLIYGPISEGIGRRRPLMVGILIFIAGSMISILARKIEFLILGRLIQGLGAGACSSLWRSIFRDVYTGDDLAKYGSWLSVIITFFVPVVPILGGYLQHYMGWEASFGFLLLYGVLTLGLVIYTLPETSQHHHKDRLKRTFIVQTFKQLLTSRIFMGYSLAVFFCYGAFFSWFAVGPVLLIKHIGISPVTFGWISFVIGSGAMGLAGTINGRVVKRLGGSFMLRVGFALMFVAGGLLLLGYQLFNTNLYAITLPVFLFYFGVTFVWPNAFAGAFTPFGTIAGYAGALYSFMQLGGGALIGNLTVYLPSSSPVPLALIFMSSALWAWFTYEVLINRKRFRSYNLGSAKRAA